MHITVFATIIVLLECFVLYRIYIRNKVSLVGNIVVTKQDGITLFSLEVEGNPETLASHKKVAFNIIIPDEESNRE